MKRVALFIGLNQEGKILLQHKTADAPQNANLWVLFGGSLEEGEEAKDAITRELKEELNISITPQFFKTYTSEESWGEHERNIFYGAVSEPKEKLKATLTEGDDVNFFSPEELKALPMNKNHFNIINSFLEKRI